MPHSESTFKSFCWTYEMAKWIKIAANLDNLGLIPRTHMVRGEKQIFQVVLSIYATWHTYLHTHVHAHTCTHTQWINKCTKKGNFYLGRVGRGGGWIQRDHQRNGIKIHDVKVTEKKEKESSCFCWSKTVPKWHLSIYWQSSSVLRIKVPQCCNLVDLHLGLAFIIIFFFLFRLATNWYSYFILILYLYIWCLNQSHHIFWT